MPGPWGHVAERMSDIPNWSISWYSVPYAGMPNSLSRWYFYWYVKDVSCVARFQSCCFNILRFFYLVYAICVTAHIAHGLLLLSALDAQSIVWHCDIFGYCYIIFHRLTLHKCAVLIFSEGKMVRFLIFIRLDQKNEKKMALAECIWGLLLNRKRWRWQKVLLRHLRQLCLDLGFELIHWGGWGGAGSLLNVYSGTEVQGAQVGLGSDLVMMVATHFGSKTPQTPASFPDISEYHCSGVMVHHRESRYTQLHHTWHLASVKPCTAGISCTSNRPWSPCTKMAEELFHQTW